MKECYHLSPIKTFISKRCHDKEEQIRLWAFFAGSFLALIFMSLHVFGFFGIGLPLLQFISWIRLLIYPLDYRSISDKTHFFIEGIRLLCHYISSSRIHSHHLSHPFVSNRV